MKKYLCIVFILSLFISMFFIVNAKAFLPLTGKIIIVDAGHGGLDPGTSYNDILEKDINLKISLYLEEELSKLGASVILTRESDYDLSSPNAIWRKKSDFDNRIKLINNSDANLYLSIHLNYLNQAQYKGIQVFSQNKDDKFAKSVQEHLNKKLNSNRENKVIPKNTYMYSKLKIKGLLIECGFLSNYEERNLLITEEYQKKIASAIAEAISKY